MHAVDALLQHRTHRRMMSKGYLVALLTGAFLFQATASELCAAAPVSCDPYRRSLAGSDLRICPIFNGVWTSFLDQGTWGGYKSRSLETDARLSALLDEMDDYERRGFDVWIGEDFDQRVMSLLRAHRSRRTDSALVSIIVERQQGVEEGMHQLLEELGLDSMAWVHLGPPALGHLRAYARLRLRGYIQHVGVEDFSAAMLEEASSMLPIATVQQEINLIVRPSPETQAFCVREGCTFVAYGALLGGLLSEVYLGAPLPQPDAAHSKQWDYLASIQVWGGWERFQILLRTLHSFGNRHGGASVATVALAYTLSLPRVLGVILGMRLGARSEHRGDTLHALALAEELTLADFREIEEVVQQGVVTDGLART